MFKVFEVGDKISYHAGVLLLVDDGILVHARQSRPVPFALAHATNRHAVSAHETHVHVRLYFIVLL